MKIFPHPNYSDSIEPKLLKQDKKNIHSHILLDTYYIIRFRSLSNFNCLEFIFTYNFVIFVYNEIRKRQLNR